MGLNLDMFKAIKQNANMYFPDLANSQKEIAKIAQNWGSDGHFEVLKESKS